MALGFGVHTGPQNTTVEELQGLWLEVEDLGFDWLSIWDHFYAADVTGGPVCLEAVTMHTALAMTTTRVRCGSLVYSVGYRHPAVLAKAIAAIDLLSGGRAVLGLGAGWQQLEYDAYGLPFPPVGVRLHQLEEALQCVRGLLTQESTTFAGEHFRLKDARCEPKPAQARLPIWVGGGGEKVTLGIVARHADGWNVPFVSPEDYARKIAVLRAHCDVAGRDPGEIEKTVNVGLSWREDDLEGQFGRLLPFIRSGILAGSTQQVVDRVGEYRDAGAQMVILALRAPFDTEALARFAGEVAPAFR